MEDEGLDENGDKVHTTTHLKNNYYRTVVFENIDEEGTTENNNLVGEFFQFLHESRKESAE